MALRGENVDLTVQRSFQRGVDSALRDAVQIGFAQCHVDDVKTVVAGHSSDLAGKPESRQYAVRVVVGSPADVSDRSGSRRGTESFGTQFNCGFFDDGNVAAGDQQLYLVGRHRQHLGTRRLRQFQECGHALV